MKTIISSRAFKLSATFVAVLTIGLTALFGMPKADEPQYITIKGSDTMVHLVSTWAEEFMKTHPDADISVTGGGSGTGIAALLNGTTDICAASRKMKEKEYDLAKQKKITPTEYVVAQDGLALIVNPKNPINELTVAQLGDMFTGKYTNWKEVGGPDKPIILLSRESSSGTFVFFQEHVLGMKDYATSARLMPATSAIVQSVEEDAWTIGYVGLGYAEEAGAKVKILNVKADAKAPAVTPSEKTVTSGEYAIARPLHLYTNGEAKGMIKEFVNYCLGEAGQKIVRETGYVPVGKAM